MAESTDWEVGKHLFITIQNVKLSGNSVKNKIFLGMGSVDDFRGNMGSGMSGGLGTGMAAGMGGKFSFILYGIIRLAYSSK